MIPVITIDGPVGVGKGTVSRLVSQALGWHRLESGALYRAVAWLCLQKGVNPEDAVTQAELANKLDIRFEPDSIVLCGHRMEQDLRTAKVDEFASLVAQKPEVRRALLNYQRSARRVPGLVAEGRDMGSVVFGNAPLKIYLTATAKERANRRYKQLKELGKDVKLCNLMEEVSRRDERDKTRANSPLICAKDAKLVDSTKLSANQVSDCILNFWKNINV